MKPDVLHDEIKSIAQPIRHELTRRLKRVDIAAAVVGIQDEKHAAIAW